MKLHKMVFVLFFYAILLKSFLFTSLECTEENWRGLFFSYLVCWSCLLKLFNDGSLKCCVLLPLIEF